MTRIHLCELDDHRVEPGPTGITFLTDNILTEYERLKSKGVHFINQPKEMEWGNGSAHSSTKTAMSSILSNRYEPRNGPCNSFMSLLVQFPLPAPVDPHTHFYERRTTTVQITLPAPL